MRLPFSLTISFAHHSSNCACWHRLEIQFNKRLQLLSLRSIVEIWITFVSCVEDLYVPATCFWKMSKNCKTLFYDLLTFFSREIENSWMKRVDCSGWLQKRVLWFVGIQLIAANKQTFFSILRRSSQYSKNRESFKISLTLSHAKPTISFRRGMIDSRLLYSKRMFSGVVLFACSRNKFTAFCFHKVQVIPFVLCKAFFFGHPLESNHEISAWKNF